MVYPDTQYTENMENFQMKKKISIEIFTKNCFVNFYLNNLGSISACSVREPKNLQPGPFPFESN